MKKLLLFALLTVPVLGFGQAYKCTVNGVTRYQASPCEPDAKPLDLKVPSVEIQAKMRAQEAERDQYWAGLKKAEADKQAVAAAERERRYQLARRAEHDRQRAVLNARMDATWQDYVNDRQAAAQRQQEFERAQREQRERGR